MLGAGDGFMSGLLRGWLKDEPWRTSLDLCQCLRRLCRVAPRLRAVLSQLRGAAVVSRARLGTPGAAQGRAARAYSLGDQPSGRLAGACGSSPSIIVPSSSRLPTGRFCQSREHIPYFKKLCLSGRSSRSPDDQPGYGILCDDRLGREALHAAAGSGLWIGRPVELPGSRPLALEIGPDYRHGSCLNGPWSMSSRCSAPTIRTTMRR